MSMPFPFSAAGSSARTMQRLCKSTAHDLQRGIVQAACEGLCARGLEQAICSLLVLGMECTFVSSVPDGSASVSVAGKEDLTRQALEYAADDLAVCMLL